MNTNQLHVKWNGTPEQAPCTILQHHFHSGQTFTAYNGAEVQVIDIYEGSWPISVFGGTYCIAVWRCRLKIAPIA